MTTLLQDLRYGCRMLLKSPGLTAIALITLALGIGVNTGLYTILQTHRSLAYRFGDPESLVFIWSPREHYEEGGISALDFADFRAQAKSFAETAVYNRNSCILTDDREPAEVGSVQASAELLPLFGFEAQLGRLHTAEEDAVGAEGVVLLTDKLWQRRYDGDPGVLDKIVQLNDKPHRVIGVLPPEVDFEDLWYGAEVVVPARLDPAEAKRDQRWYTGVARLKPGVSAKQAQAELSGIAAQLEQAYPDTNKEVGVLVKPLLEKFRGDDDALMEYIALAAVGAVLLIACVNLANMLLAKATGRGREFAIRTALGAGRGRIVRQLLTESAILAVAGGGLGLLVGSWVVDLFMLTSASDYFRPYEVAMSVPVLVYALVISSIAALFFGLAPALAAARVSVNETLKEGGASSSAGVRRNRLRSGLVVMQLALGLPMFVCCGLAARHVQTLKSLGTGGLNPDRLITMDVQLPRHRFTDQARKAAFFAEAVQEIAALPGVKTCGAIHRLPIGSEWSVWGKVVIEGHEDQEGNWMGYQPVSLGYFQAMEIPLLTGRLFSQHDQAEAQRVALVNQRMAKMYWPDEDPLGRHVRLDENARWSPGGTVTVAGALPAEPENEAELPWITVVGVVGDSGCNIWGHPSGPALYLPLAQKPSSRMAIVARTSGEPVEMASALRGVVHSIDPGVPVLEIRTVEQIIQRWLRDDQYLSGSLGALAALALCLASMGLYGVMSYSVSQRTHEIGVRVALGAQGRDVVRLVLKRCLVLAGLGVGVGLVLTIPLSFLLASQLYGVGGADPVTFAGVILLLVAVALAAGYLPARRATKVDPMVALRCE